jgi:hypothetical protein
VEGDFTFSEIIATKEDFSENKEVWNWMLPSALENVRKENNERKYLWLPYKIRKSYLQSQDFWKTTMQFNPVGDWIIT